MMNLKATLSVTSMLLIATLPAYCQISGDWQLVYHNDGQGKAISGRIESLIDAVREGRQIRIYWFFQHPTDQSIKVEHVADATFLTILSDREVMAQIDPIVGQIPDFEKLQITLKENLEWSFIASTSGNSDTMTRDMITGEIVDHTRRAFEIKWWVQK